jgi:GNAT superfamily N-acetyltransferase
MLTLFKPLIGSRPKETLISYTVLSTKREANKHQTEEINENGVKLGRESSTMTSESSPILRELKPGDIPAAMELSAQAGWNQTEEDWRMLIDLAPRGCLAIEVGGELASTATLFCYGQRLAWIGMVLTRISYRGRGFARRLLTHTLSLADELGIESVKLDATEEGKQLYEKLGFRSEQAVERWERSATVATLSKPIGHTHLLEDWFAADFSAFGAERSELLLRLAHRNPPITVRGSYLLTRPGRRTRHLGPCVASDPGTARTLLECALQSPSARPSSWDILPENRNAVALAHDLGFAPKRHLMRMFRGKALRGDESAIYAIAGFELG